MGGGEAAADGTPERAGRFPAEALPLLRCPVCRAGFAAVGRALRCPTGHSFDVAREGYVNLLPGGAQAGTADTREMVAAREVFLAAGHFAGMRDFVRDVAMRAGPDTAARATEHALSRSPAGENQVDGCLLDVGAGTGYYLAALLDRLPGTVGLALDISKFAVRRAARAHERIAAVVCDAWDALPVADSCAAIVLDVFAPRNASEFRRVLRRDGALVVVTPSPRHFEELVASLGLVTVDKRKPERLEATFAAGFMLVERVRYEEMLRVSPAEAGALAAMGPSARHLQARELAERLSALGDPIETTLSVIATVYTPRPT